MIETQELSSSGSRNYPQARSDFDQRSVVQNDSFEYFPAVYPEKFGWHFGRFNKTATSYATRPSCSARGAPRVDHIDAYDIPMNPATFGDAAVFVV